MFSIASALARRREGDPAAGSPFAARSPWRGLVAMLYWAPRRDGYIISWLPIRLTTKPVVFSRAPRGLGCGATQAPRGSGSERLSPIPLRGLVLMPDSSYGRFEM